EPNAAARPLDPNLVGQRLELDLNLVGQRLIERLAKEQAAVNRRWEQQYNSLRAEEAMYRTEQVCHESGLLCLLGIACSEQVCHESVKMLGLGMIYSGNEISGKCWGQFGD
uniref:Uncharacterized protein n=1 Tax=Aegilops tauschii subsp. strangulata TaxID=200361 RepID=A0A453MZ65_AEGTS